MTALTLECYFDLWKKLQLPQCAHVNARCVWYDSNGTTKPGNSSFLTKDWEIRERPSHMQKNAECDGKDFRCPVGPIPAL